MEKDPHSALIAEPQRFDVFQLSYKQFIEVVVQPCEETRDVAVFLRHDVQTLVRSGSSHQ